MRKREPKRFRERRKWCGDELSWLSRSGPNPWSSELNTHTHTLLKVAVILLMYIQRGLYTPYRGSGTLLWLHHKQSLTKHQWVCIYLSNRIISLTLVPEEKAMSPHSSTLAWKIPWTDEPGGLQSMGLLRVGHDWMTSLSLSCIGGGNGNPLQCSCLERGSLVGCCLWGCIESDTIEVT